MGLDTTSFVVLCWVVTALLFVGSVYFAVKVKRQNIWTVLGSTVSQLLVCVFALLAAGATLNVQNQWYASWTDLGDDLFGDPPVGIVHQAGATQRVIDGAAADKVNQAADAKYAGTRNAFQATLKLKADPGQGGQEVVLHIPGMGDGQSGRVTVWVPSAYTDPAQAGRTFPVIEAFHGVPGDEQAWLKSGSLGNTIGQLAAEKAMSQSIVVLPYLLPDGQDTECVNGGRYQMETWITEKIPQWIIEHFRVNADRDSWATMGYSMGGWCAAMAGLLHPDRYGAAIVLGGYFHPIFGNWQPHVPDLERYNLLALAKNDPPNVAVWVEISGADSLSKPPSLEFIKEARAPLSVTSVTYPNAGHRFSVWMNAVPHALIWLAGTLPSFAGNAVDGIVVRGTVN